MTLLRKPNSLPPPDMKTPQTAAADMQKHIRTVASKRLPKYVQQYIEMLEANSAVMWKALEESAKFCGVKCKGHDVESGEPLCAGCPSVKALSSLQVHE